MMLTKVLTHFSILLVRAGISTVLIAAPFVSPRRAGSQKGPALDAGSFFFILIIV